MLAKTMKLKRLSVYSSSHKTKKAVWGKYTEMKQKAQKLGNKKEEAREIADKYYEKFGCTSFNSCEKKKPIDESTIEGFTEP